ncbi:hypothetical protein JG688_00017945 [Phytophthora aleatoria]|uniref:Uncharacterized protein n=1 Tax=Phytophthora aleatoria TaxID=2496075 RepID=A0A8J5IBN9_9STRA|nr:hypothetical protein JG688_00017945 [Phytophthora aleatoria]
MAHFEVFLVGIRDVDARVEEVRGDTAARATKYVYVRVFLALSSGCIRREVLSTRPFRGFGQINSEKTAQGVDRAPLTSPIDLNINR